MSSAAQIITRVCPQCGRVLQEEWKSCPYCGRNFVEMQSKMPVSRSMSTVSIILGAISLIVFGIPLGITAIVCGAIAVSRNDQRGIIGIVIGIIGIVATIAILPFLLGDFSGFYASAK